MSNVPPPPPQGPPVPPAGPPVQPPQGAYAAQPPLRPEDQRLWATLIHVGGILFAFLPSLIGYLVLKDRGEFIKEHTKSALNFQITMLIAYIVAAILTFVIIGIILYFAVIIVIIIFSIMGAIAANKGELYSYPKWCTIQFIK
ncbi:DUF4870 domain-containing protein [Subtercola lobariae]|uniref:Membrane protein n=1 Tax=Subtercola lobariae TaxID=1588641 RepID=A0A917BF76_9MICO|nr:DUF4870 domain-containing protein [Subtercola lobariae]GGF40696.1 membrane protein [Subtercola lobariae]